MTGDDYYWQHQHQLQQSALRFTPRACQAKKANLASAENVELPITEWIATNQCNSNVLGSTPSRQLENNAFSPTFGPYFKVDQLITTVYTRLETPERPPECAIADKSLVKDNNTRVINKQLLLTSMTYKNHQLFINDNLVELALNTTQLSKQQTNELQQFIKQWLTNKGYALKRLIINGVSQ